MIFLDALSGALADFGQEIFNATILALAVVMSAWHNIWMAKLLLPGRVHSRRRLLLDSNRAARA